ncbi:hypothetical protein CEE37_01905 [candidate division LCP-89 bacterium B3_LCP]|uniref:Uncharacterized protein n=1 Tax=candidate division LCP-89 bacterium B3_LCP TaxID=2012998 RepID=A0A532V5J2_UNCL8|nr:MAG: hypothetical protein CEE37_01905 [candidate division LCP-89 bacterium B3_LCP]
MNYKPNLKEKSEGLIVARRWGIGIITSLLGAGMLLSEIDRIKESWPDILVICYVALFALTGVLVWLWVWATRHELIILWRWLDPRRYKPPSDLRETAMILSLGVLLSVLFFASRDVFFYSIFFSIYGVVSLLTNQYLNKEILAAIEKSRQQLYDELLLHQNDRRLLLYNSAIDELEYYFLKRSHKLRHVIILFFSSTAFVFACISSKSGSDNWSLVAYVLMFMTILISELVIAMWRIQRDDRLRTIEADVDDLERTDVPTSTQ